MADVAAGLLDGKRIKVVVNRDPLGELDQARVAKSLAELRLSDEDELQNLVLVGVQIGEQAQLLEGWDAHVLRLVDQKNGAFALRVLRDHEVDKCLVALDLLL